MLLWHKLQILEWVWRTSSQETRGDSQDSEIKITLEIIHQLELLGWSWRSYSCSLHGRKLYCSRLPFQTRNLPGAGLKFDRQPGRCAALRSQTRCRPGQCAADSLSACPGRCRPQLVLYFKNVCKRPGQLLSRQPGPSQWQCDPVTRTLNATVGDQLKYYIILTILHSIAEIKQHYTKFALAGAARRRYVPVTRHCVVSTKGSPGLEPRARGPGPRSQTWMPTRRGGPVTVSLSHWVPVPCLAATAACLGQCSS